MTLLTLYWYGLFGSLFFAILFFLFGDLVDTFLDDLFHPLLIFGSLAVLSGSGILFTKYSSLNAMFILVIGIALAIITYLLIYNYLIIPISQAESSSAHSSQDYHGRIGEVITTIPAHGYGEVWIESVSGSTNEIAKSFDQVAIPQGTRIIIIEVNEDGLYVSPMDDLSI